MNLRKTTLGFASLLLLAGAAQAQIVEDFETGNPDSWQIDFNGTFNGFPITATTGTVVPGNPGNGLFFANVTEQIGPWFLNSPSSAAFSGDLRAKGVDGITCDMMFNPTASSPFGSVFVAMIGSDMGTPEITDDVLCWKYDFAYAYLGFGPGQLPANAWNHCTWALDTQSATLPAGWTLNTINNSFIGDLDAAWNVLVQNVSYVAFANGAPWGGNNFGAADYTFDNITLTGATVGTPFCFCDGSGTTSPCGNPGAAGNGCANGSNANGANLAVSGSSSIAQGNLVLNVTGATPGQPGLFFQGVNAVNAGLGNTFGDGLRCAGGSVVRLQIASANGSGAVNSTVNVSAIGGVAAGDTRYYQFWPPPPPPPNPPPPPPPRGPPELTSGH
ncbi:MAG: hypothetical protein H6828_02430 [Planctomycetes bacterium]|nr:hypothetical protein [Planctomycetota bacterium]